MRSRIDYFIIGPCGLESLNQVKPIVDLAKAHGIQYFRGNIFKPRTSPESFQGLGIKEGLPIIEYLLSNDLKIVSEPCSIDHLETIKDFASIIQIGARNMQNFEYLKSIGRIIDLSKNQKVMLKRGFSCNMEEWLESAKYLELSGIKRENIILCERGSRNFAAPHGVTLDLGLATKVKLQSDYKIIIDPSHGSRSRDLVLPLAKGAMAMNFNGIMLEVHPEPEKSKSDSQQALGLDDLDNFLRMQSNLYNWKIEENNPDLDTSLEENEKNSDRIRTASYN